MLEERHLTTGRRAVAIIRKKVGTTVYVYDSVSYWDKDLKQPRSKRKLIGKIDPVTGEIVPTGKRGRKAKAAEEPSDSAKIGRINVSAKALSTDKSEETTAGDMRYTDLQHQLPETEAALAEAERTVARLRKEKEDLVEKAEKILQQLKA